MVSTHSRPKAAGPCFKCFLQSKSCFNTQPPEGGWALLRGLFTGRDGFNTQPPEGGWKTDCPSICAALRFNTQPPEGGWPNSPFSRLGKTGFNTQPPEGGWVMVTGGSGDMSPFQHTAARRRLGAVNELTVCQTKFQHTAARRRLDRKAHGLGAALSFNTQPPEGGWAGAGGASRESAGFNTQPPEGGWFFLLLI